MKALIISQARMTSTRLPGKVLMKVNSRPMLEYHIQRLSPSKIPVVVATTTNKSDEPIVSWCEQNSINFYRGEEHNVLKRYYEAAQKFEAKIIIRVTSDCPLIDGEIVQQGLKKYQEKLSSETFLSNTLVETFPRGFDFAIFSFEMLEEAFLNARNDYDKEHVTPYFRDPDNKYNLVNFPYQSDESHLRITLDTQEDFKLLKVLIEKYNGEHLNVDQLIEVFRENPQLKQINQHVIQKS